MTIGQIYGTGSGITAGIDVPPPETIAPDEREFWAEVDKFKAKADEAFQLWQRLRAKRQAAQSNPELNAEYDDVMQQGENITTKISDVERAAAAVRKGLADTITGWFGLEGYHHAARQLGQLGVIQFAAIALITAAVAWLGSWVVKGNIIDRKLTAVENLHAQGVSISDAGDIIAEKGDPGPLQALFGNIGTGIAVAGVVGLVLYFFMEKKRGF